MEKELFDILDRKLDKQADSIEKIRDDQSEMRQDLNIHMRRSEAAEGRLDLIEDEFKPILEKIKFTKWIFSILSSIAAIVLAILHYLK